MNFVPAVAYLFCLALPEAFTQPGDHLLAVPCTSVTIAIGYMIIFIYMVMAVSICRFGFSFINVINEAGTCLISCHNEEFPQRVNELKLDSFVAFNIDYCPQPYHLSRGSGPGFTSPTGSFRSSSRFFSFLGTTFSSRWERPPPTYDEAMKHVNPDTARDASSRNPAAFLFLHGYMNLKEFHLLANPEPDLGLVDYCSQNENRDCELRLSLAHPVGRSTRPRTVIHSGGTPTPPQEEGEQEEQEEEERQFPFPLHLPRLRLGPEGGAPLSAAAAVMSSRGAAEPAKEEEEEEPSQTQGLGLNRCVSPNASF